MDEIQLKLARNKIEFLAYQLSNKSLNHHGMQKEIDDMWQMSKWFFDQPREEKLQIIRTETVPLGY